MQCTCCHTWAWHFTGLKQAGQMPLTSDPDAGHARKRGRERDKVKKKKERRNRKREIKRKGDLLLFNLKVFMNL